MDSFAGSLIRTIYILPTFCVKFVDLVYEPLIILNWSWQDVLEVELPSVLLYLLLLLDRAESYTRAV